MEPSRQVDGHVEPQPQAVTPGRPRPAGLVGPFSGRQLVTAALVVIGVGLGLFVATLPIAPAAPAGPLDARPTQYAIGPAQVGLSVGDLAPELTVTGAGGSPAPLRDLAGNPIRMADLRGHPVWINFWASWCPPCQAETPTIRDLWTVYRPTGLALVGISVQEATEDDVRAYAARYGLTYRIGADLRGDLFRSWHVYGLPTQFFIDANGVVRAVIQGPVTPDTARAALAAIGVSPPGASPAPSGASPASSAAPPSGAAAP